MKILTYTLFYCLFAKVSLFFLLSIFPAVLILFFVLSFALVVRYAQSLVEFYE